MMNYFIPEGVSDLNYDDYEKINTIEKTLIEVFRKEGYRQIKTPTFEYLDLFSEADKSLNTEDMYKFTDASGKLMVLRPDATIPIARMVATHYKPADKEVKLAYLTDVFRSADFSSGEKREFKQAGIEYFGSTSPNTDADIIMTAVKALTEAGYMKLKTELGDARYFDGFMEELKNNCDFISEDLLVKLK